MEVRQLNEEVKEKIQAIRSNVIPQGYIRGDLMIKPLEWKQKSLKEIITSYDYGTSKNTNDSMGYPVLRMGNMKDGKLDIEDLVYLELSEDEFNKFKLNKGDILFNRTNSADLVGKVSLFDLQGDYVCASYIVRFAINKDIIDSKYVSYYMNTKEVQRYIKTLSTKGVQQVNVNPTILSKYLAISFPEDNEEQKKIIQILSTWDKAIDLKNEILNKKNEQKQGISQRLLSGNLRLSGYSDNWKTVLLNEVLTFPKKKPVENPERYKLLTVKLYAKGVEATDNIPNATENGRPYYLREPNEILIGRQNFHNGGIGIVPKELQGYVASNAISSLIPKYGDVMFYYYYLSNVYFYKKIDNLVGGTGQKEISELGISKLKMTIPMNIEEQRAISGVIYCIDKEIELLQQEIEAFKEQKKGLMQLLLTGIVRVKVD